MPLFTALFIRGFKTLNKKPKILISFIAKKNPYFRLKLKYLVDANVQGSKYSLKYTFSTQLSIYVCHLSAIPLD